jgi:uncharacterized protein YkwD
MFRLLVAIVTSIAAVLPLAVVGQPAFASSAMALGVPGDPAIVNLISGEQSLLDLTNADRAFNGVAPLEFDPQMLAVARERAAVQLGSQSLSHYDANGQLVFVQLLQQANLPYLLAGENLARSSIDDSSVTARIEQALMQSPLHRKNILDPTFRRVAVGLATGSDGQVTFAEIYRD